MGVPIQSSLVQEPCKSGSPQGVFGCVHALAAEGDLGACATAGWASSKTIAAAAEIAIIAAVSPWNRWRMPVPPWEVPNGLMVVQQVGRCKRLRMKVPMW